ncbi:CTD kinase subunit alpha [Sphaceloma murrayae]|uniref:cyclin-dependent kinase n=1 Tax=Sphaceloma murrayae TaxID=2082308 RepID=A0A2K1QMW8_9PEZI|nr:CTD kinase subunit alpha [Sphaceloma murrayae]
MDESSISNRDVRSRDRGNGKVKSSLPRVDSKRQLSDPQARFAVRGEDLSTSKPSASSRHDRRQSTPPPTHSARGDTYLRDTRLSSTRADNLNNSSHTESDVVVRDGQISTPPPQSPKRTRSTERDPERSSQHSKKRKSKVTKPEEVADKVPRSLRKLATPGRPVESSRGDRGYHESGRAYRDERHYDYLPPTRERPFEGRQRRDGYPEDLYHSNSARDPYYPRRRSPAPARGSTSREYISDRERDDYHRKYEHRPPRDLSPRRRSPSPDDLISALASHKGRSAKSKQPFADRSRHSSRSPPPPPQSARTPHERSDGRHYSERDYRDHYGKAEWTRARHPETHRERDGGDDMYGRGGHHRGGYQGYNQQYPGQQYYGQSQGHPYGRGGYHQQPYASHHGSPPHGYSPHGYQGYSHQGSPYYQQSQYPPQQSYHHPPRGAHAHDPPRAPVNRSVGPPAGAQKTKGGHFANLSWTPNSKKTESNASVKSTSPAPTAPASAVDEEEDNPFRPPKDFRAEDEAAKREKAKQEDERGRKPISFTIKGAADKKDPPKPASTPTVRMVKELVIRKRMKPRPELDPEHVNSESVYYRKDGNESVVGSGTYGKVYKAIHVYTKNSVALKKIRMDGERDGFPVTAIREIKLLQSLHHPNIVALQETMVEKNDCFMIFEYLSHDLTGLLNHPSFDLTPAHKKDLAKQLFEGLDYLHRRGVLHRDIKAANILVSKSGQLKIADFGLARFYAKNRKQDYTNRVITIWYRPPELLLGETQYGPAVDIWSAACVLVEIFTRHAIFPGDGGEINQLDKIYNVLGTPSRSVWPGIVDLQWYELLRPQQKLPSTFTEKYRDRVTPEAFQLLEAMFQFDPELRPAASDVLEHPYFTVEEPGPKTPSELAQLDGDWHEFESKALRKERDREARRVEKERREKEREGLKRGAEGEQGPDSKRVKVEVEATVTA